MDGYGAPYHQGMSFLFEKTTAALVFREALGGSNRRLEVLFSQESF